MAEILEREGYRVKIKVGVPTEEVLKAYDAIVGEYARKLRVPGFRLGKVPKKVVVSRVGEEALMHEVRERLMDDTYPSAVKELSLLPVSARLVEGEVVMDKPFDYVVEVENYPEAQLPDWRGFVLSSQPQEVTDEMVVSALEELRRKYAEIRTVDREAREADHVVIETGESSRFPVDLTQALPHVREVLLGVKAGEEVQVPVKDDDGNELRKTQAKVIEIKEVTLPELDEEFAKTVGKDSLDEVRVSVHQSLTEQTQRDTWEAKKNEFLDWVARDMEAEIPPSLIHEEQHQLLNNMKEDLARQGVPVEDYMRGLEKEDKLGAFNEDLKSQAEQRVRRGLALERLVEELGTELSEDEWKEHLAAAARSYGVNPAEFQANMGSSGLDSLRLKLQRDKALAEAVAQLPSPEGGGVK